MNLERQTISNVVNYDDTREPAEPIYYGFHKNADLLRNDLPIITNGDRENKRVLAIAAGNTYSVRIDDTGRFVNPIAPLKQRISLNRFAKVSKKVFDYYLSFLKTGNKISLTYAEREQV